MARADREAAVAEIVESFNGSAGAVLTEYRGLTVKQLQDLRRSLGENANYAVVKNTLAKIAANQVGISGFDEILTGPTAIAFINGDVVEAAKGLRDFAKANPALVIKGGVLDGKSLDAAEIAKLADLESREVLLGKLAGGMLASLSQAVYLLNAPLAQVARLAGLLDRPPVLVVHVEPLVGRARDAGQAEVRLLVEREALPRDVRPREVREVEVAQPEERDLEAVGAAALVGWGDVGDHRVARRGAEPFAGAVDEARRQDERPHRRRGDQQAGAGRERAGRVGRAKRQRECQAPIRQQINVIVRQRPIRDDSRSHEPRQCIPRQRRGQRAR